MRISLALLLLLSLGPFSVARAQGLLPPWSYPDIHYHSSTYEEGVQRGFADIVRSAGAANLMNSEAAKNYEQVRRMNIDNRVYGTEKYFQTRQINRAARAAERGRQPTMEDLVRYASQCAPNRLSPSELDPISGVIAWPRILREPAYEAERQKLELLYASRSAAGYLTSEQVAEVEAAIQSMTATLKANLSGYSPQLYAQAKEFLKSLAFESLQRPG